MSGCARSNGITGDLWLSSQARCIRVIHVHIETRILSHQLSHLLRISLAYSNQHDVHPSQRNRRRSWRTWNLESVLLHLNPEEKSQCAFFKDFWGKTPMERERDREIDTLLAKMKHFKNHIEKGSYQDWSVVSLGIQLTGLHLFCRHCPPPASSSSSSSSSSCV